MKRVLLTGATGFIGRCCLALLSARGYEVHAVSSQARPDNLANVHWHQADLLNPAQLRELVSRAQPTHLLHLAWYAVPGKYWTSQENLRWVTASLNLLQAFVSGGGERVVIAGTCAEYDWRYGYCSESITPLLPATLYGTCKHSLQLMLDALARQTELSAAWGRIFFLYGPHEHSTRLVASVIRSVLQGEPARCSHGNQIRDLLFVQDVADAFVALLESEAVGAVNIASGQPVTLRDLIYKIAEKLNREDLILLGAIPAPANEPRMLVAAVDRLRNEIGWLPRFDLDEGLDVTIKWWQQQLEKIDYQHERSV